MDLLQWILASIGNLGVWFTIYNRVHATQLPRRIRKATEKVCALMVVLSFGWLALSVYTCRSISIEKVRDLSWAHRYYLPLCILFGVVLTLRWCWRKYSTKSNAVIDRNISTTDLQKRIGSSVYESGRAKLFSMIPLNQSHLLATEELTLRIPRLPAGLEGLKVAHISDFHLMRLLSREWFEEVIAETNRHQPDLVLVTGDLLDEDECLDWIDTIFGRLESEYGIYFIRGNHDRRVSSQDRLLRDLSRCGMTWVGDGKLHSLTINDCPIEIVGNEIPWFHEADNLPSVPGSGGITNPRPFRILLSHSPDQHPWCLQRGFDLMLAGHCHGGQVRLPVIGPLVAPSKYGVRYAGGGLSVWQHGDACQSWGFGGQVHSDFLPAGDWDFDVAEWGVVTASSRRRSDAPRTIRLALQERHTSDPEGR